MEYDTKGKVLKKAVVWKDLYFYQKSDAIYQLTVEFCRRFLPAHGDRTVDQMVQAARSGKQNIAEGNEAGTTSMETNIKLMNVAKASLKELQEDYEDYLRTHGMRIWSVQEPRCRAARDWCRTHNATTDYMKVCQTRDDETVANVALIAIHQTDYLLYKLIEKLKEDFLQQGGIKEQMSAARRQWREEHGMGWMNGYQGKK